MGKTFHINREDLREKLYHRRYVLPNAVTVGNMFCGFLAIIYASTGRFNQAVIAILIAILLDGLDGRVARKFNATSKFGVEFDSFSDLISFGIGPAALVYFWCFKHQADEFGVLVSFIYALCAACRLARFNINHESLVSFQGLPSPAAAALVASMVNLNSSVAIVEFWYLPLVSILVLFTAFLMVSNISFVSIKKMKVQDIPVRVKIGIALIIGFAWYVPKIAFFTISFSYALSWIWLMLYAKLLKRKVLQDAESKSSISN